MTEEEAKEKWCPMAMNGEVDVKCIGSDCMVFMKIPTLKVEIDKGGKRKKVYECWCGLAHPLRNNA